LDSEQYEIKCWDWDKPGNLRELITLLNQIRRANPALHSNDRLRFHGIDNDRMLVYSKTDAARTNSILSVVNLDPHHTQSGWVDLALGALGIDADKPYTARDLLTGAQYLWQGARNYVLLDPALLPAHVLRLEQE
jgi:starch synthase (maltosyl-transferring)